MIPALSQICSLPASFPQEIEDFAAGQCRAMELWFTKMEEVLAKSSLAQVKKVFLNQDMSTPVCSLQGGLLTSQGDARRAAWDLFRGRMQFCRDFGASTIVIAGDILPPLDREALERTRVSLKQAADEAHAMELRLAFEFQAKAAFANNIITAASLVDDIGSPALGLCLDLFHFYTGPSQTEDLGCLTTENLFHVQVCDLLGIPREFAADSDRILPGEGDIPLAPVIERLKAIDYRGLVSLEVSNPQIWQVPPLQLGEIAMTSLRKLLGQASP